MLQSDALCLEWRRTAPAENTESHSDWVKTPVANLVRCKPSDIYFTRVRTQGKLFRQRLACTRSGLAA